MTAAHASAPEPGQKPVYPFAEWLDGRQWVLTRGRDFWGDHAAVVTSLQASARARRVAVTCTWDPDQHCLYVRAHSRGKAVA